jgi:integrase
MIDSGLCRNEINRRIQRIVRMFQWAVEEELIPVSTYQALRVVPPLRPGQSGVRESEPVRPVPDAFVEAVQPYVSRQVWAMIQLQRLTGMRPGEVRTMRTIDVETSGPVWVYTPQAHKTRIYGYPRKIYLGPQAQEVLRPWLRADPTACLFQPREAMAEYWAGLRRGRRSPAQSPGWPRRNGDRRAGEMYSPQSYSHAISAGIAKANREAERTGGDRIPRWHPRQLHHSAAMRLLREFGLCVAQAVLGHRGLVVAPVYAERGGGQGCRGRGADRLTVRPGPRGTPINRHGKHDTARRADLRLPRTGHRRPEKTGHLLGEADGELRFP